MAVTEPLHIQPGQGLGYLTLGASLYDILSTIKSDTKRYPTIDVHFSQSEPLSVPVVVSLPHNGLRLRFDGADQRLRLIEILDFGKTKLAYKGSELVKLQEDVPVVSGPPFKRVYQIFGASYPGEYLAPTKHNRTGTYVLSWPGIAFTFPLQHSAWSPGKDHVSMLGSHAASPASHMAIFDGNSWPEVRRELFTKTPTGPRSSALALRSKESLPAEIEQAIIRDSGQVELLRRQPSLPFTIVLNETTRQDLITELGPPDATHKRGEKTVTIEQPAQRRTGSMSRPMTNGRMTAGSQPASYSSTGTDSFDTDFDSEDADEDPDERANKEVFWCYFAHGMDILVGPPRESSTGGRSRTSEQDCNGSLSTSPHLVVTKVVMHGNVPGSYAFNRHRRLRWTLDISNDQPGDAQQPLDSETDFETVTKPALLRAFADVWPESEMARGKVVNRTWGADGPSDSSFFLPDADEDLVEGGGSEQWISNTKLYTLPGLVFEVQECGAVIGVTLH